VAEGHPIVVGCDGSPDSDNALRFAAQEARLRATRLTLVCAYYRPVDPDLPDFDLPDAQLRARTVARGKTALRRALDLSSSADLSEYEFVAVDGDPGDVLVKHAADAAMIVIGGHQHSVLQRLFKRETSTRLLHDSDVPVAVVPAAHLAR
jgi:nucleotide-binding universal stress UspA family protein